MVKKYVVWYLVAAMFVIGIAPRLDAALAPSEVISPVSVDRAGDLTTVRAALENKLVAQRLQDLGYSVDEIGMKLSQLSDEQLHKLALNLDQVRVGQDGLGIVIGVLVVIVLVLVILQLTGHRVLVK